MKTKTNYEELLIGVEKLIYKQAWKAAKYYGMSFEEALSECHLCFVNTAYFRFDPKRGSKFSTFLQNVMRWHFKTLATKHTVREIRFPVMEINEETAGAAPPHHSPCMEAVEGLSKEAQEIIKMLIETPAELLNVWDPCSPGRLLGRVKKALRNKGHSHEKLEKAHLEIQETFRAIWNQTNPQRAA